MGLGKGKTEHAGPRDMTRKHGHWGYTDEAKQWATSARRRDERLQLSRELEAAKAQQRADVAPPRSP
jgi:hypothetical protein